MDASFGYDSYIMAHLATRLQSDSNTDYLTRLIGLTRLNIEYFLQIPQKSFHQYGIDPKRMLIMRDVIYGGPVKSSGYFKTSSVLSNIFSFLTK